MVEIAKNIKPSHRGELEITTVNQEYLNRGDLKVELMGRGYAWLDTGTHDSLIDASNYIRTIESRQGLKVACLEVIACKMGYITNQQLLQLAEPLKKEWLRPILDSNEQKNFHEVYKIKHTRIVILCEPDVLEMIVDIFQKRLDKTRLGCVFRI